VTRDNSKKPNFYPVKFALQLFNRVNFQRTKSGRDPLIFLYSISTLFFILLFPKSLSRAETGTRTWNLLFTPNNICLFLSRREDSNPQTFALQKRCSAVELLRRIIFSVGFFSSNLRKTCSCFSGATGPASRLFYFPFSRSKF
jgi:hypothetical protein